MKINKILNMECVEMASGLNIEVEKVAHFNSNSIETTERIANSFYPSEVYTVCQSEKTLENLENKNRVDTIEFNEFKNFEKAKKEYDDLDLVLFSSYPPFKNYTLEDMFDLTYEILDYKSLFVFLMIKDYDLRSNLDESLGVESHKNEIIKNKIDKSNFNHIKTENFKINGDELSEVVFKDLTYSSENNLDVNLYFLMKN